MFDGISFHGTVHLMDCSHAAQLNALLLRGMSHGFEWGFLTCTFEISAVIVVLFFPPTISVKPQTKQQFRTCISPSRHTVLFLSQLVPFGQQLSSLAVDQAGIRLEKATLWQPVEVKAKVEIALEIRKQT